MGYLLPYLKLETGSHVILNVLKLFTVKKVLTIMLQGTGRARIKDKRAPHFQYGGRPLGRRPRDHGYDIDLHVLAQGFSVSSFLHDQPNC